MKESLKKPILFAVIVVVGSVLVLFDIPLVILVPFILFVGFFTLLLLGSITIAEIREGIAGLGKSGILRRLNDIKFFEKKTADTKNIPSPLPEKKEVKKEGKNEDGAKPGLTTHITAFFSSIGSLGSVLRQRSSQAKKVEDINRLLDKTVSEKVPAPASADYGAVALNCTPSFLASGTAIRWTRWSWTSFLGGTMSSPITSRPSTPWIACGTWPSATSATCRMDPSICSTA